MARYIEFTTSEKNIHVKNTFGSPIHDGKVPNAYHEILGVLVDGNAITFLDEDIPDKLHRALLIGKELKRNKLIFDCKVFAALMNNVEIGQPNEQGVFNTIGRGSIEEEIDLLDTRIDTPLNLGIYSRMLNSDYVYFHTVTPAHTTDRAQYLHKLGDNGPVCMSTLSVAMQVFNCPIVHPAILGDKD